MIWSTHCHNDLGIAVANSLAAIRSRRAPGRVHDQRHRRARRQHLARGSRDGDRDAERRLRLETGVVRPSRSIRRASSSRRSPASPCRSTSRSSATTRSRTRPASIRTACSSTSMTYEIMRPESVGRSSNRIVLGKHSGRHAFVDRLKQLGFETGTFDVNKAFERFKALRRPEEERLRRGPARDRRGGSSADSGALRARLSERHLVEHGGAARDGDAQGRRRRALRQRDRGRHGRRLLPRDQENRRRRGSPSSSATRSRPSPAARTRRAKSRASSARTASRSRGQGAHTTSSWRARSRS